MTKALILVGGEEEYHDLIIGGRVIQKQLTEKGIAARFSQDFSVLTREKIHEYDVCLFHTFNKRLTQEEQAALEQEISNGMGFIPLHGASFAEHAGHDLYLETVGCKFSHHDPFKCFQVEVEKDHFITENVDDFNIEDELYVTEKINEPDLVLAQAEQDGELHPLVYFKELGKGRICYIALGHDGRAWYNPAFVEIVYRSVIWAGSKV